MFDGSDEMRQVEEDLSRLGAAPEAMPAEIEEAFLEDLAIEHEAWKASLDPWTRFEVETGLRAAPESGFTLPEDWTPPTAQDVAETLQDSLVDLDRSHRRADAARTVGLLDAYEAPMRDLAERFGATHGLRTGVGAQGFLSTTGLRLGMHPLRVAHLLDTATTCRDRFPRTWRQYVVGAATWQALVTVVRQAEGLDEQHWAAYDERAAREVGTSTRLKDTMRRTRERLQDDTAPQPARLAAGRRCVVLEEHADGQASLTITGPAPEIVAIDQALSKAAIASHRTGETRTIGQLRHDIAIDLLLGGMRQAATPGATVPVSRPVAVQLILTVPALAAGARSMVRVLTDPVTGVRLTINRKTRRPPKDLRRWIAVRDEHCRFPGCRRPASHADVDHAQEWQNAGLTEEPNLVTLCRRHHDAKSRRLPDEELLATGSVTWSNPWRHVFEDPPPEPMDPAPADLVPPVAAGDDAPCPF